MHVQWGAARLVRRLQPPEGYARAEWQLVSICQELHRSNGKIGTTSSRVHSVLHSVRTYKSSIVMCSVGANETNVIKYRALSLVG